nr:hypothetical protein BDOA9_0201480 [Bradyrhizobium sp. DOA9]
MRNENDARLPAEVRFVLMAIADGIKASADKIERLARVIVVEAKHDEDMHRLTTIPAGAITAATIKALVGSWRVQVRSPLCRTARINAGISFKRRQRAAGTNIEDGKSVTPLSPRCRGNGRLTASPKRRSDAAVAEGASRQTALQGCCHRAGQ